ncbi:MAG: hypothetical protein ACO20H_13420 [Bacteriovoracaceae bacterium]
MKFWYAISLYSLCILNSLLANEFSLKKSEQDFEFVNFNDRKILFIGEYHHKNIHLTKLIDLLNNEVLKVDVIFFEYLLEGQSLERFKDLEDIQNHLIKRKYVWSPERARQILKLKKTSSEFNVSILGIDKEDPKIPPRPVFLWRISQELHKSWINTVLEKSYPDQTIIVYGGKYHGKLLRKNGIIGLKSYIWNQKKEKYKKLTDPEAIREVVQELM